MYITDETLRDKLHVFVDRKDAGIKLSEKLVDFKESNALILAIPSGGVPVAVEVARSLDLDLDLVLVRKIQIPWNTETGFGAADPDGEIILNQALLNRLDWITEGKIEAQINKTVDVLKKRNKIFREDRPFPKVENRTVIVIDDGLASGYTMLSALRFLRRKKPAGLIAAVPTGHLQTVDMITPESDMLFCLNVREGLSFAVAGAYVKWHDVTDREVVDIMELFYD
jgi:predicted phosphoribosyltransferase